jgi:hypothetical protein
MIIRVNDAMRSRSGERRLLPDRLDVRDSWEREDEIDRLLADDLERDVNPI